jgi:hypothetical protein
MDGAGFFRTIAIVKFVALSSENQRMKSRPVPVFVLSLALSCVFPVLLCAAEPLPDSYRSITLGMNLDAVKEALFADMLFGYRGERDVSLLPTLNRTLIETSGSSFISRSWFQFNEEKLYIMTFNLDTSKVDYFSVYSQLVEKYGEPKTLDPRKALWQDERIILTLERPLTVKYVDAAVFASLLDQSGADMAVIDLLREDFVNEF